MSPTHLPSKAKRNGLSLTLLGALLILAGLAALGLGWQGPGMVALLAAMVVLPLGIGKLTEPPYSLSLTAQSLVLHHRRGGWSLNWADIQRIDQPSIGAGFMARPLPFVGIRLKDPDALLGRISPRLAVGLLMETRGLLVMALRQQCPDGRCPSEDLFEDGRYRSPSGQEYQGVLAMLGLRMKKLHELLGYDLFIPEELTNSDAAEAVGLLRRYWAAAAQHQGQQQQS
ncbi:DUF2982 domain-containing protein [Gallaecimonas sp. GXIMD4217]|uniref:DUF2982 domain-containing protein n=1 Tax=Gallaecimonas sp. GXIMD4217 TaxID=3131927 RepID=UPI00311B3A09